jgi:cation diffusion facilitator family transporter
MKDTDIAPWTHSHVFDAGNEAGARNSRRVVVLTATMMVVEIVAGWLYGSMALLADGWHMSTHAAALGMTALAYSLSRRHAGDERFSFGAWKIEVLGGFASAIVLAMVALYMAGESVLRLFQPHQIRYDQALAVAALGLVVNLICAMLLGGGHGDHEHDHAHGGHDDHPHHDLNLRSAYVHVVADALTSVLAIVALTGGRQFGWSWLDPAMGIVGSGIVGVWSYGLIRDTSRVLLDREMDLPLVEEIRAAVESHGDARIVDLHLMRVGRHRFACVLSVITTRVRDAEDFKARLHEHEELVHVTVEIVRSEERLAAAGDRREEHEAW